MSGVVPVEISVDPGGEIFSDPVPLLRTGGGVVDQLLHVGRVQPVLLVGGVDVVHQPLVPRPEGGAAPAGHDWGGALSVIGNSRLDWCSGYNVNIGVQVIVKVMSLPASQPG